MAPPDGSFAASQRLFRKHKTLPHPRKSRYPATYDLSASALKSYDLTIDTALSSTSGSQPTSPQALKQQARRKGTWPDLPPTPPAHSRTSSSSHSAIPSSPTYVETPEQSTEDIQEQAPTTPTNQRSPPTPDVTPPQPERRPKALRPVVHERLPSKSTTGSRTESFKTARENPESSDEDDGKSTLRPGMPSARTSQNTVRPNRADEKSKPQAVGLGLGLESSPEPNLTPRSKGEFMAFDGEWGSASEVEQEWDDNLMRNVTVKKRRPRVNSDTRNDEVIEDVTITPTNATKAVRAMPLHGKPLAYPSPQITFEPIRRFTAPAPSTSDSSFSADVRRSSGMSSKSTVSTVVEAILVDTPPRRQKTLRHVKKLNALRDSSSDISPPSTAPTSVGLDETERRRRPVEHLRDARVDSVASSGTMNSLTSRKARREIWKNGGIPVVVVPDRLSSVRSDSKERSLRSTSSRHSRRSQSLSSAPLSQVSRSKDLTPYFERPSRRGRATSESDGSTPGDQRTMDYPPIVPRRTSSLSAPTSRNTSRAGSLTSESLKAHNALQDVHNTRKEVLLPAVKLQPAPPVEPESHGVEDTQEQPVHKLSVDKNGDPFFGKRLSAQVTPFSQASVETTGTSAAEISEAMAVSIVPHQNKSVLMVDHKPSDGSDGSQKSKTSDKVDSREAGNPTIVTSDQDGNGPVTPPQFAFSMDDVDSPLRNPRSPPEPPAINFIPATPSGLTPAQEKDKQLGNFYEVEAGPKPTRNVSLVRRALGKRRHSEYGPPPARNPNLGFLTRTFSLSKNIRRETAENPDLDRGKHAAVAPAYPTAEDKPADEGRLHPFWRPAYSDQSGDEEDDMYDMEQEVHRYPPIDNRPHPPRRSFSDRMKRTFAIMPIQDEFEDYIASRHNGPERRTIKRTPSGNLRVVKHRGSVGSLRHARPDDQRPYTAPDQDFSNRRRHFWQSYSFSKESSGNPSQPKKARLFPGLGSKLEEYSLQNLPRRFSERRREKRSKELRQKISGPREVRDGVGDVIRRNSCRDAFAQAQATR